MCTLFEQNLGCARLVVSGADTYQTIVAQQSICYLLPQQSQTSILRLSP